MQVQRGPGLSAHCIKCTARGQAAARLAILAYILQHAGIGQHHAVGHADCVGAQGCVCVCWGWGGGREGCSQSQQRSGHLASCSVRKLWRDAARVYWEWASPQGGHKSGTQMREAVAPAKLEQPRGLTIKHAADCPGAALVAALGVVHLLPDLPGREGGQGRSGSMQTVWKQASSEQWGDWACEGIAANGKGNSEVALWALPGKQHDVE